MQKERLIGIDLLKVLAVFLVMNSHMRICYPKYSALATGGAIGDALFFFASGYTLLLSSNQGGAITYFIKRIKRIYPSLFGVSLIAYFFFGAKFDIYSIITGENYWFISCILVYYILFWPIKKFSSRINFWKLFVVCSILVMLLGLFVRSFTITVNIYGGGVYRLIFYFIFMLLGAIMGVKRFSFNTKYNLCGLTFCLISYYTIIYLTPYSVVQVFSLIPLLGIAFFSILLFNEECIDRSIKNHIFVRKAIYIIGSLCLDTYLIQKYIITDVINALFPLNIPIIMIAILVSSYILNILANLIRNIVCLNKFTLSSIFLH